MYVNDFNYTSIYVQLPSGWGGRVVRFYPALTCRGRTFVSPFNCWVISELKASLGYQETEIAMCVIRLSLSVFVIGILLPSTRKLQIQSVIQGMTFKCIYLLKANFPALKHAILPLTHNNAISSRLAFVWQEKVLFFPFCSIQSTKKLNASHNSFVGMGKCKLSNFAYDFLICLH